MRENFSCGKMHFSLPANSFQFHARENGKDVYYGKQYCTNCICCDVLVSCEYNDRKMFEQWNQLLKIAPASELKNVADKFGSVVEQGRYVCGKEVVEITMHNRTFNLHVKDSSGNYYSITTALSHDRTIPISKLRDFAYEILDTVKIY